MRTYPRWRQIEWRFRRKQRTWCSTDNWWGCDGRLQRWACYLHSSIKHQS